MPTIEIPDFIMEKLNKLKHKDETFIAVISALATAEMNRRSIE